MKYDILHHLIFQLALVNTIKCSPNVKLLKIDFIDELLTKTL